MVLDPEIKITLLDPIKFESVSVDSFGTKEDILIIKRQIRYIVKYFIIIMTGLNIIMNVVYLAIIVKLLS